MDQPNPSETQKCLSGAGYPVDKGRLLDAGRGNGAGEDVPAAPEKLPENDYNGPNAVSAEVSNA
ncbi:DUF2795 domain-containing protein [Lentzea sp. DG1S-22]|uniref:DUF2795 domain-containing protein n=1 Tax=Lentzea sp. DG1S-22 TaxID=3108822 RepID=UPI002E75CA81|nr:DUF2795 domain-containing protein [Lentzea sp. DG1S-22]WVH84094.1 DUF2795 domain-containing protein [Lentzea sp. DG1S-22]